MLCLGYLVALYTVAGGYPSCYIAPDLDVLSLFKPRQQTGDATSFAHPA